MTVETKSKGETANLPAEAPTGGELVETTHPMLEHARSLADGSAAKRFRGGAFLALKSAKFLYQNKTLWPNTIAPALINMVLFVISAAVLLFYSGPILEMLWAKPIDSYWVVLWWIVRIITIPVMLILSYVNTMIVGAIIASPFLTALSERTESIYRGVEVRGPTDMMSNVRGAFTAVVYAIGYFGLMLPIFMLNIIPGLGSVAATILGGIVSSFFLGLEYTDFVLDRRGYSMREKFRAIWDEKPLGMGFGLGTSFLLWVPFVNFLCMPIAVVGGTAVAVVLDERKGAFGPTQKNRPPDDRQIDSATPLSE